MLCPEPRGFAWRKAKQRGRGSVPEMLRISRDKACGGKATGPIRCLAPKVPDTDEGGRVTEQGKVSRSMRDNPRGFLLVATLFIITGLTALIGVSPSRSTTELLANNRFVATQQAFHIAEAGVDAALVEFTSGGADRVPNFSRAEGWADQANNACDPGESCTTTFSLGTAAVTVRVSDIATSPTTITSTGATAGSQQTIEMVVEPPPPSIFEQAIFGLEGVRLDQGIIVNSYDSTKGPYTLAPDTTNRKEHGDVRTNSTETNTLTLNRNVQVFGDVLVGAHGIPSVVINQSQGVQVSGTEQAASNNLTLPAVQIPAGTPCGGPLDVPRGATQTVNLNIGPFCYSSISVQRDATLTIDGNGRITLGDNARTDLTTAPNSTIQFNGNVTLVAGEVNVGEQLALGTAATLKLYATESASLKGFINTGQDPKDLSIVYTGTSPMTLTQSTSFYGTIYAPNAEVDIHQHGDFFGSVVARQVSLDQNGRYHFDESLRKDKTEGVVDQARVRSWRQP